MAKLLKTQKNAVLLAIQAIGLNPSDFEWREIGSIYDRGSRDRRTVEALVHPEHGFFVFDSTDQSLVARRSPGPKLNEDTDFEENWNDFFPHFETWIEAIKAEIDAPDLWELIGKQQTIVATIKDSDAGNQEMTEVQQVAIKKLLPEIVEYIKIVADPNKEQLDNLQKQVAYLIDSSERLSQKDWLLFAIGQLGNIVTTLALDWDKASKIFNFCNSLLVQVMHGLVTLPETLQKLLNAA